VYVSGGSRGIGWRGRTEETQRGWGPGAPRKFLNFKSKNGAFCALLSTGFKVCRLITETVYDHIRKTMTNRLCFPSLLQSPRGKNQEVLWQRGQAVLFPTLHYMTAQAIAVDTVKWEKERFKRLWSVKAGKSLINDIFCWKLVKKINLVWPVYGGRGVRSSLPHLPWIRHWCKCLSFVAGGSK